MILTKEREQQVIALCQALVGEKSYSGHESGVVSRMKQAFQELGYDDAIVDSDGSVLGRIPGRQPGKTILLDGHIDTVPVPDESKWTHAPYGGELADGRIYGRGASDMKGAVAQSLVFGLAEEMILDRSGRMVNANFADYKMFSSKNMPRIITILVPTEEPLGPYGAKSIAEVPINTATPAVINAVYHTIGIRFRKLPVRPEDVPQTLTERAASRAAD